MFPGSKPNTPIKLLSGDFDTELDGRNRIKLGDKFKALMGSQCVLALTEWGSVCAYPTDAWNERLEEILACPANNPGKSKYIRLLFEMCEDDAKIDGGRLVIPAKLREAGKLVGDVYLYGAGLRLEIWNPEEFKKHSEDEANYGRERRERMKAAYAEMTGK